ncbi:MAG: nitroreductase [Myxococcota bacterium]|nr:nitroreductase [Myxococcota bacterium]
MDPKACAELIAKRRSLRPSTMSQAPVPRTMINSILEAANWAPSHRLTEPWRFVVMQGEARRRLGEVFEKALLESTPDADEYTRKKITAKPMRSPVLIAVICQPSDLPKVKQSEEEWAVACAVQNMALQATAHGLSIFWSTGTPVMHPMVSEFFGCRGKALVMGCLHLGFIGEEGWPEGRRGAWENKVRWVSESQFEVPAWQPTPRSS